MGMQVGSNGIPLDVLIVDDDPDLRDALAGLLALEGFRVATARNGLDALAVLRCTRPEMIVCDLRMPVMDGWALIETLRADPNCLDIPVLVMTAVRDWDRPLPDAVTLQKPIRFDRCLETIHKILLESPIRPAPAN